MNRLFATLAFSAALAFPAAAQIQGLPRASQHARTVQTIGIAEIEVTYHRPSVQGRKIWGDLVPFGELWRAGANENTIVALSHAATIEGKPVPAGVYGLHMIPGEGKWTVVLSKDSTGWGSYSYDVAQDAGRFEVVAEQAPFLEWLRYDVDPVSQENAVLALHWEKVRVPLRIEFETSALVLEKIRADLEGPAAENWRTWYDAAKYCADSGLFSEEALAWSEHAVGMQESFACLAVHADLLTGLGREDEARATLDAGLAVGNGEEIARLGNALLDANRHARAAEVLSVAVEKAPQLWWAWVRLGDAHAALGAPDQARAAYDRGLELAPPDGRSFVQKRRAELDQ